MTNPKQIFTKEGYTKIIEEIKERETIIRVKIADEIEKARQQGDLSENAAYKASIEAKEFNENRITQLKEQLTNAEVMTNNNMNKVGIGRKVKIKQNTETVETEYLIVGHNEADPLEKKISLDSPLGKALENKKVGDTASVSTPGGVNDFIIVSIN